MGQKVDMTGRYVKEVEFKVSREIFMQAFHDGM